MSKDLLDTRPFVFKQFSLSHHRSTMKVGIDAILLGIWTSIKANDTVLDIGTGSGIISLILASRGVKSVDAIDIDEDSIHECTENFSLSPWCHQMQATFIALQEFSRKIKTKYSLIVSNPPFFIESLPPSAVRIKNARHTELLSYRDLVMHAKLLLLPNGRFSVVLPYKTAHVFLNEAAEVGLYLHRRQFIFPRRGLVPNRINLELSDTIPVELDTQMLNIREEDNVYTPEFKAKVDAYYID